MKDTQQEYSDRELMVNGTICSSIYSQQQMERMVLGTMLGQRCISLIYHRSQTKPFSMKQEMSESRVYHVQNTMGMGIFWAIPGYYPWDALKLHFPVYLVDILYMNEQQIVVQVHDYVTISTPGRVMNEVNGSGMQEIELTIIYDDGSNHCTTLLLLLESRGV